MEAQNGLPLSIPSSSNQTSMPEFFVNVPINLGSPFFGMWLSTIMFGILTLQTWRYFQEYHMDPYTIKTLVITLWLLDAFDLSLLTYSIYRCAVLFFGDVRALVQLTWMAILHGGLSNVITLLVQGFFTRRVWVLSRKNKILTLAIAIFSLISFGAGLHYMIRAFIIADNLILLPRYSKGTFITSAVVADILIAGSQCYYLVHNKTGVKRVDLTLKVMMGYIVNTMLLTTTVAILELVLWVTRNDATHLIPDWTICRLYSNSLLAVLNTRRKMRERMDTDFQLDEFVVRTERTSAFNRTTAARDSYMRGNTVGDSSTRVTTARNSSTMGQRDGDLEIVICHSPSPTLISEKPGHDITQTSDIPHAF